MALDLVCFIYDVIADLERAFLVFGMAHYVFATIGADSEIGLRQGLRQGKSKGNERLPGNVARRAGLRDCAILVAVLRSAWYDRRSSGQKAKSPHGNHPRMHVLRKTVHREIGTPNVLFRRLPRAI